MFHAAYGRGITVEKPACQTILLVEDQAEVAEVAEAMLEELGYRVICASDAAEALELIGERDDIDLLMTDIVMPGSLNGADLALRARNEAGLKAILVTGYADQAIPANQFDRFDVLLKPFRLDELEARIKAALAA